MAKKVATPKVASVVVSKKLSSVFLVSSAVFATLSAAKQTATLAEAGGLPVEFLPDFVALSSRAVIRDKLLTGSDISRELEFNGVTLDAEELRAILLVKPVLAKIQAIGPKYPWLKPVDHSDKWKLMNSIVQRLNGNYVSMAMAKGMWKTASAYWGGGEKSVSRQVRTNGSYYADRTFSVTSDSIKIGCNTIPREEVEWLARHFGWEPNIVN
jgi:hypothetical protein